jgi:pimeloyl-ACP methyl ester carboxylesterase
MQRGCKEGVFVHDEGEGAPILFLLHSTLSSSAQWRKAAQILSVDHRVIAPDFHGEGKTEAPADFDFSRSFACDTELVSELLGAVSEPVHLVGHSYGGVVALKAAHSFASRIASLTLIEPVAFYLLRAANQITMLEEVLGLKERCKAALREGDDQKAAELFVSYWSGPHSWQAMPQEARSLLSTRARKAVLGWEAMFSDPNWPQADSDLRQPTLILSGDSGPYPARWIARRLAHTIPGARFELIPGAGHMAPISHPDEVNAALVRFIRDVEAKKQGRKAA